MGAWVSYPDGTAEEPVGGISWYEAAAFAVWAGRSLPTVFHWHRAAQQSIFSEILLASNFDGEGPAPAGRYQGLGPVGTFDMAGNVKEWCFNRSGTLRYILGGSWSDPSYRYRDAAAADPMDRSATNGFRTVLTDGPLPAAATVAVDEPFFDFALVEPVADDVFDILRGSYRYDDSDLDARVESVDESSPHWREEIVSIRAAYGGERVRSTCISLTALGLRTRRFSISLEVTPSRFPTVAICGSSSHGSFHGAGASSSSRSTTEPTNAGSSRADPSPVGIS